MNYYRITKYNPAFRNNQGAYTKNDWTSVSDIGQTFDEGTLTIEEYKNIEDAYVKAVNIILQEKNVFQMTVHELEKNDCIEEYILSYKDKELYKKLTDLADINLNDVETTVRLNLRELIWCVLSSYSRNVKIEFGYDYYMYVECDEFSISTLKKILDYGLFVELLSENE